MIIRPYEDRDRDELVGLWQKCDLVRAWNNPDQDIQRKCINSPEWFLVGELEGAIVATVMAGYDGHRGWLNYLAVEPGLQGSGYGRQIVMYAEQCLLEAGCPKINLQIRNTNLDAQAFYEALGYARDPVISLGKRLIPDD